MDKANEQLPFDVLGHIFSYYAAEENIKYPLETLLLVCRTWSDAALGHRALWKHLRVYIGHEPTPTIWNARLPLRLARCGPDIDLNVDLRNLIDMETYEGCEELDIKYLTVVSSCKARSLVFNRGRDTCSCLTAAGACIKLSLQTLTGSNGEHCARWRSLALYLGKGQYSEVGIALSQATPLLEHLELGNVRFEEGDVSYLLFPEVRALKQLILFECHLPSHPSCDKLLELGLHWDEPHVRYPDLSSLRCAVNLQSLSLRSSFSCEICLPAQLPNLRELSLAREIDIGQAGLSTCQMPRLSDLWLEDQGYYLLNLHRCEGLPIESLTRVSLSWMSHSPRDQFESAAVMTAVQGLLIEARGLKYLDLCDYFMTYFIKALWNFRNAQANPNAGLDDTVGPVFSDVCVTNMYARYKSIWFDGSETTLFLEELARKWYHLAPNLPDNEFARATADYLS